MARPLKYNSRTRAHIGSLVRKHNATVAMAILNADANGDEEEQALAQQRSTHIVPAEGLGVSMPTVLKIAKERGVELKRGRPRKVA